MQSRNKWLSIVAVVVIIAIGGSLFYAMRFESIFDDGIPRSVLLDEDTRVAIENINEIEKNARKVMKNRHVNVVNNATMSVVRANRYGYYKQGLSKVVWNNFAGKLPEEYVTYLNAGEGDAEEVLELINRFNAFTDPVTVGQIDFVHMVAVIDVFYSEYDSDGEREKYYDYLMSWGGDLETYAANLTKYIDDNDLEGRDAIYDYAVNHMCSDEPSYFSREDFLADIDGVNIAYLMIEEELLLSDALVEYYGNGLVGNRFELFVESFGGEENFKEMVYAFVLGEVPSEYIGDEEYTRFVGGFSGFKSTMLMFMGINSRETTENEKIVLAEAFIDNVISR